MKSLLDSLTVENRGWSAADRARIQRASAAWRQTKGCVQKFAGMRANTIKAGTMRAIRAARWEWPADVSGGFAEELEDGPALAHAHVEDYDGQVAPAAPPRADAGQAVALAAQVPARATDPQHGLADRRCVAAVLVV